jgi:hypothetical protein
MIRSAFSAISRRPEIRTPVEIVPVGWYKKMKGENKKWHKDKFGDFADVVMNMIPKHRLVESTVITHTLKDKVTGLEVSVSYPEGTRMEYDASREMRVSLTRMVNSIEVDEDDIETDDSRLDVQLGEAASLLPQNVIDGMYDNDMYAGTSWLFDRPDIES